MKQLLVLLVFTALVSCKPGPPTKDNIREILLEPENVQEFAYADFGPAILTYRELGKPMPFDGVAEKEDNGWKVGNIRVLVVAESYLAPHLIFLKEEGLLKPDIDYRIIWHGSVIQLLDDILADPKIPESQKERPRRTREKIIREMGDVEEMLERTKDYRVPLEAYIREHKLGPQIDVLGKKIMSKGQSR